MKPSDPNDPNPEQLELLTRAMLSFANGLTLLQAAATPSAREAAGVIDQAAYTRKAAAKHLGVSPTSLDRYRKKGRIGYRFRNGRNPMYHKDDLDRLQAELGGKER